MDTYSEPPTPTDPEPKMNATDFDLLWSATILLLIVGAVIIYLTFPFDHGEHPSDFPLPGPLGNTITH